jgi:hypothetical protein
MKEGRKVDAGSQMQEDEERKEGRKRKADK